MVSARLPLSSAKPGRRETTRATIAIAATRAAFTVRTAGTPMPKIWGSAPEPQCPVDRDQGFLKAVVQCNGLGQLKASSYTRKTGGSRHQLKLGLECDQEASGFA